MNDLALPKIFPHKMNNHHMIYHELRQWFIIGIAQNFEIILIECTQNHFKTTSLALKFLNNHAQVALLLFIRYTGNFKSLVYIFCLHLHFVKNSKSPVIVLVSPGCSKNKTAHFQINYRTISEVSTLQLLIDFIFWLLSS